jgi:hypothetical protein
VGWAETNDNLIHGPSAVPHYSAFGGYRWVRVGGIDRLNAARDATIHAALVYNGRQYKLTSNRFVSAIMKRSGITLTLAMTLPLGWVPGICACGTC